jgi:LPXTG-motif cell wall-anchored protein
MNKNVIAVAAGLSLAALGISPANAATVNNVSWSVDSGNMSGVTDTYYDARGLDDSGFSISLKDADAFNTFSCDVSDTETTEPDGDFLTSCDAFQNSDVAGIQWKGSIKIFAGDYNGLLARQVVSLKNTTTSSIVIDYAYYIDTEEANDYGTTGTPDGDRILEDGETWWVGANDNDALEGIAFGTDGYARGDGGADEGFGYLVGDEIIDEDGTDDFYHWNSDVTVPAGATINFVYFYTTVGATEHGSTGTGAQTDATLNLAMHSLFTLPATILANARLMEGIEGGAYNWGTVPPVELAATGVDATSIMVGGALALVAGAGVYAVRRRRVNA